MQLKKLADKTNASEHRGLELKRFGVFASSALLLSLLTPYLAQAQVTADTSQAGKIPTVKTTPGNTTYVDIAKANGAGVSHNRYTEFNVSRGGLILNNNSTAAAYDSVLSNSNIPTMVIGEKCAAMLLQELDTAGQARDLVAAGAAAAE